LEAFAGYNDRDFVPATELLSDFARDPDVTAANDTMLAVAHAGKADTAVTLFAQAPIRAPIQMVLSSSRLPRSATEIALAPHSAHLLDARVGTQLKVNSPTGVHALTVVGIGFVPTAPHNDYDNGGWVAPAGYTELFQRTFKFHLALISVRPDADPSAVMARLGRLATTKGSN
jgi:hypothetical protein